MDDLFIRFRTDLVGRLTGPMTFHLLINPCIKPCSVYPRAAFAPLATPPHDHRLVNAASSRRRTRVEDILPSKA